MHRLRARAWIRYTAHLHRSDQKSPYTIDDIDVLFAHIIPLDTWYVLPTEAFAPCKSLRFYPQGCNRARFEHYREAWHLLRPKAKAATQGALV